MALKLLLSRHLFLHLFHLLTPLLSLILLLMHSFLGEVLDLKWVLLFSFLIVVFVGLLLIRGERLVQNM